MSTSRSAVLSRKQGINSNWLSWAAMVSAAHCILSIAFLAYVFIGVDPFPHSSAAARTDGNPLDRLIILSMTGLALLLTIVHWRALPSIIFRGIGIWMVVGLAVLSVIWSDYPSLTIRRSIALACLTIIAAGVAIGIKDLRRAHTVFAVFLAMVVGLNLLATLVVPGLAVSDIGVKGIYSQKNVAGSVAMIAVIAHATWLAGGPFHISRVLSGAAMLCGSLILLMLSESKTSIGLTALSLLGMAFFLVISKTGPRAALGATMFAIACLSGLLVLFALNNFDMIKMLSLVLTDVSFTGRDELWRFAFKAASERPWGGHGYGAFWDVGINADPLNRVDPGSWLGDVEPGIINQAHNGYLELWLQLGIPATVLAILVFVALAVKGALFLTLPQRNSSNHAAVAFLTVMPIVFLAHNLTEASIFVRGILLCNILLPIMFILARLSDFTSHNGGDYTQSADFR